MKNVRMTVDKNLLTITVDLTGDFGPSSSGKTTVVATSAGNAKVTSEALEITNKVDGIDYGSIFVGLNVFKK